MIDYETLTPFTNKNIKIYKSSISFAQKDEFMKHIQMGYELSPLTIHPNSTTGAGEDTAAPGWMYPIQILSNVISDFREVAIDKVKSILDNQSETYCLFDWTFEPTNITDDGAFHVHSTNFWPGGMSPNMQNLANEWTFTYYFQMPENDDGYLWFKNDDETYRVKPEVEDLYLFPASLLHRYDGNKNSSVNRFVYACSLFFINSNKKTHVKKTKSLI
jgi:hypothetical protein